VGQRVVRSAASLALVVGFVALTWLVIRAARLPSAQSFIASLPVRSQVLVGPAGGARPDLKERSAFPSRREGDRDIGTAAFRSFVLRTSCEDGVCEVSVERAGATEACGISPVASGSLQLREARTVGLWFFDGWSQTGEGGPAQLAFRDADLRCVWPTDFDLATLVKPRSSLLALSLGALLASCVLLWRRDRPAREAAAFSLSLLMFVPVLPWTARAARASTATSRPTWALRAFLTRATTARVARWATRSIGRR